MRHHARQETKCEHQLKEVISYNYEKQTNENVRNDYDTSDRLVAAHECNTATTKKNETSGSCEYETKYRRTKRTNCARREEGRGQSYVRTYGAATKGQVGEKIPLRTLDADSTIGGAR